MNVLRRFVSSVEPDDVVYARVGPYGFVSIDVGADSENRACTDWSYADAHKIADWIKENVPDDRR